MPKLSSIRFSNLNSRDTYFTIHNINKAHMISKGKGIKVGIIDWLFAVNDNSALYSGAYDVTGLPERLYEYEGHGLWMASVLKEIAPECEIYAINAVNYQEGLAIEEQDEMRAKYLIKAIDWAIENNLDILTYSTAKFDGRLRDDVYDAINRAVACGLITTFIHCDCESNIFPYGCYKYNNHGIFKREPDVNIYHYDYNTLFLNTYHRFEALRKRGEPIGSGDDIPFFSFSSMSPVLGGFIALLKSKNKSLTSEECRELLINTSYEITREGDNWYDLNPCPRVVDIGRAVEEIGI